MAVSFSLVFHDGSLLRRSITSFPSPRLSNFALGLGMIHSISSLDFLPVILPIIFNDWY